MSSHTKEAFDNLLNGYVSTLSTKKKIRRGGGLYNDIGFDDGSSAIKKALSTKESEILSFLTTLKQSEVSDEKKLFTYCFIQAGLSATSSFIEILSKTNPFVLSQMFIDETGDSVAKLDEGLKNLYPSLYNRKLRFNEDVREFHKQRVKKEKVPFFQEMILKENQVEPLFEEMKKRKWLDIRTDYADFLYYFQGKGEKPADKLIWRGKKTILCLFLKEFEYAPEWTVAEAVFERVSAKSLKTMASKTYQDNNTANAYWEYEKDIRALKARLASS